MLDEFTEYLLETRVNTSADFNTYPIRIFYISSFLCLFRGMIMELEKGVDKSGK